MMKYSKNIKITVMAGRMQVQIEHHRSFRQRYSWSLQWNARDILTNTTGAWNFGRFS
jgi:hypothetical protein